MSLYENDQVCKFAKEQGRLYYTLGRLGWDVMSAALSLEEIARCCIIAREKANSTDETFITYLLDMLLLEVGRRIAEQGVDAQFVAAVPPLPRPRRKATITLVR